MLAWLAMASVGRCGGVGSQESHADPLPLAGDLNPSTLCRRMSPTQINVRPLASPLPLGLIAFGIGMLLLAALGCGWGPRSSSRWRAARR